MHCPYCHSDKMTRGGSHYDGRIRWMCGGCKRRTLNPLPDEAPQLVEHEIKSSLPESKTYVFTAAQNATKPHFPFFASLQNYCEHNNAELCIIPIRYKNPTSVGEDINQSKRQDNWWHSDLHDYMYEGRINVHKWLTLLGDANVQLTAIHPTTGFESMTGSKSAVLAHPKLELRSIPTQEDYPKLVMTTGAVTEKNYGKSRAGKRGEFHHTYGAVVVEIQDDEVFHIRHINALNNGKFMDIDLNEYTPEGVKPYERIDALDMGDTHVRSVDHTVIEATFVGDDSIVSVLKPKYLIWHDLLDGESVNHHELKDPFMQTLKQETGKRNILEEIQEVADFVDKYAPPDVENLVVPSNHDDFLRRWMNETDWRKDPTNARFYLDTAKAMIESGVYDDNGMHIIHPFPMWLKKLAKHKNIKCLARSTSHTIRGIEVAQHGDKGANGSRGSLRGFSKLGVKSIIGHSHTPGIDEGCYQVGTSSRLRLNYNLGPSSWMHCHAVIYPNGKRALINIINGRWRLGDGSCTSQQTKTKN